MQTHPAQPCRSIDKLEPWLQEAPPIWRQPDLRVQKRCPPRLSLRFVQGDALKGCGRLERRASVQPLDGTRRYSLHLGPAVEGRSPDGHKPDRNRDEAQSPALAPQ